MRTDFVSLKIKQLNSTGLPKKAFRKGFTFLYYYKKKYSNKMYFYSRQKPVIFFVHSKSVN